MIERASIVLAIAWLACCASVDASGRRQPFRKAMLEPTAHSEQGPRRVLLLQGGCPVGCATAPDACALVGSVYTCQQCLGTLVQAAGTCGCPAGHFADGTDCKACEKGSWCPGGAYDAAGAPAPTPCGNGLTTPGLRAKAAKDCVNEPGTYYAVVDGKVKGVECPVDAYGPGMRRQRACVPCPSGYTTNKKTGQKRDTDCVVPAGFVLKGPGQVVACAKGYYKPETGTKTGCVACAEGVTTDGANSIDETACAYLLPGYYAATLVNGIVKATRKCPQNYYCKGGQPTKAFDVNKPTETTGTLVDACPDGTWTQGIGSISADQCLTPPGHYTANQKTLPCEDGQWRAEWLPAAAAAASTCVKCGTGILSAALDTITQYPLAPLDAAPTEVPVRASAGGCYIRPGQGMYYDPTNNAYSATTCTANKYGAASTAYGLVASPCRDCPAGMQTSAALTNSKRHQDTDTGGFTHPLACVTQDGYGYNGRYAARCPAGSWNPAGTYEPCTSCGYGLSTPNDAKYQVSADNCKLAVGFGAQDGKIVPCPVGTYNDELRADKTSPCTPCDQGLSTPHAGSVSKTDCNVCAAGWAGKDCATRCGGANGANFGEAGAAALPGTDCMPCPTLQAAFSFFNPLGANQNYSPAPLAPEGASSASHCLASFSQPWDDRGFIGGSATLTAVPGATTLEACVTACKDDTACQYITFDYAAADSTKKCAKKQAGWGSDLVAFKVVLLGNVGSSSKAVNKTAHASALPSGYYTMWKDDAAGIGADATADGSTASVQACLASCDAAGQGCAGARMTGVTSATSAPSTCKLIRADTSVGSFKRSLAKTDLGRLTYAGMAGQASTACTSNPCASVANHAEPIVCTPAAATTRGYTCACASPGFEWDDAAGCKNTATVAVYAGSAAGTGGFGGDGDDASSALLNQPWGLALDDNNNLYISDKQNCRLRRVDAVTHKIETVAGNGVNCSCYANCVTWAEGALGTDASIPVVTSVVMDADNNPLFVDFWTGRIWKLDATGHIHTRCAGVFNWINAFARDSTTGNMLMANNNGYVYGTTGTCSNYQATAGRVGYVMGVAVQGANMFYTSGYGLFEKLANGTEFMLVDTRVLAGTNDGYGLSGLAVEANGKLLVAANGGQKVLRVDVSTAQVTVVAGTGVAGKSLGTGPTSMQLSDPHAVVATRDGSALFIADTGNNRIIRVLI